MSLARRVLVSLVMPLLVSHAACSDDETDTNNKTLIQTNTSVTGSMTSTTMGTAGTNGTSGTITSSSSATSTGATSSSSSHDRDEQHVHHLYR